MLNSSWDRLHLMQHQKIEKKEEEEHLDYWVGTLGRNNLTLNDKLQDNSHLLIVI